MLRKFLAVTFFGLLLCLSLTPYGTAQAQWSPMPPQQPYGGQTQYPPQQPQVSPMPPPYPSGQPQYPPAPPSYPTQPPPFSSQQPPSYGPLPGAAFSDALGRFRASLPQGTMPMGATYNFGIPSAMCQVSIMTLTQDQMFQMYMQNFNNMLKQMGARVEQEQQIEVNGRQARLIAATMKDQMSGGSVASVNVFITGANVWVQVMAPEQNAQGMQQTLQAILAGLQF